MGNLRKGSTLRILVIYDSYFGNTERIAKKIGETFLLTEEVKVIKVSEVEHRMLTELEYLIIGSPTRAFRPTAAIRNLLKDLPRLNDIKVAAFDTRISKDDTPSRILKFMVNIFGYAAKPIADSLVKKGGSLVVPPEGFYVMDSEGPLKEGELERATEWANKIIAI